MDNERRCGRVYKQKHNCQNTHYGHGPSSFQMHDPEVVFKILDLKERYSFLDLGCGAGDYSIRAAEIVGRTGNVYAVDLWQEMLNNLCDKAIAIGLKNIHPVVSDIRQVIDISDDCIDVCLVATVLHTINSASEKTKLYTEIKRVLKPDGKLGIIECKKENTSFGPPLQMRISPDELEKDLKTLGFLKNHYVDLGTNYLMLFTLNK